jgi:hypothetical protein
MAKTRDCKSRSTHKCPVGGGSLISPQNPQICVLFASTESNLLFSLSVSILSIVPQLSLFNSSTFFYNTLYISLHHLYLAPADYLLIFYFQHENKKKAEFVHGIIWSSTWQTATIRVLCCFNKQKVPGIEWIVHPKNVNC